MADNIYIFEDLRAAGTDFVIDDGTGSDWVFVTGTYTYQRTYITLRLSDPIHGIVGLVEVYDSAVSSFDITFKGGVENVQGGAADDWIDGNAVANILVGDSTEVAGGRDYIQGQGGNDTLMGIGSSDTLHGGEGEDVLYGDNDPFSQDQGNFNSGDDVVEGDNGNDTLFGGFGSNHLRGGAGIDTANYSGFFDDFGNVSYSMVGSLGNGLVSVSVTDLFGGGTSMAAEDLLTSIEVLIGSSGDDTLTGFTANGLPVDTVGTLYGGTGNDSLYGGQYYDVLYGGDGDDRLHDGGLIAPPGGGNDAMMGGAGWDVYNVTHARSVAFEFANAGNDLVITRVSYTLGDNIEFLTMTNEAGTRMDGTGNALNNRIFGNNLENRLDGLGEMDSLYGQEGNDSLFGGTGLDFLYGGSEADNLSGGADGDSLFGDGGNDWMAGGGGNDSLYGGTGFDQLFGGAEDDNLFGGTDDDRLLGGTGRDRLTGGTGRDTFLFATAGEAGKGASRDVIVDFVSGRDTIDLISIAPGQTFIGSAAFSGVAGEVRFDAVRGILAGDLDGDQTADWQIGFQRIPTLDAGDLII